MRRHRRTLVPVHRAAAIRAIHTSTPSWRAKSMTMQQRTPNLTEITTSTSLQIRRPEPMHFALADSLGRAVDALDSGSASSSTLASGPRVGLENRRGILLAALAPLSAERIRVVLASFAGMAA